MFRLQDSPGAMSSGQSRVHAHHDDTIQGYLVT